MDTITQMTLGAAVGEATLGKKVGNKAILWGAVAGTLPDLDILAGPFLDPVSRMAFHRGMTHSVTFALLFAPLLGYLIYRIYQRREASWRDWSLLVFWAVVTHPLLDNFTSYGTQFFWPFSDYRIAWSTIFVIDPLYTLPLLIGVIAVMFLHRTSSRRRLLNYVGIGVSTAYLALTVVNKVYINSVFQDQLHQQNIAHSRILTSPTPFNNILWRGVAQGTEGYWEGYYSWFDKNQRVLFQFTRANHQALDHLKEQPSIKKLRWLTDGFYTVNSRNGFLYLNDMRYGRLNGWGKLEGEFVFSFRIQEKNLSADRSLRVWRERPSLDVDRSLLRSFGRRLLGN